LSHCRFINRREILAALAATCFPGRLPSADAGRELARGVTLFPGSVNSLLVGRSRKVMAVYGDPQPEERRSALVLFTHHRRETAGFGIRAVRNGASAVVPAGEADLFANATDTWRSYYDRGWRHDYAVQTSKFPVDSMPVARAVREGDRIDWQGFSAMVFDTPGYTRGAVSYVMDVSGARIACVGDLIYGDGQILDIYSLQDAVPEIKMRGYHGFAARMADLIASLRKVSSFKPDFLVPAHGPLIEKPDAAIDALIRRLRELYANYLYTAAERYYFSAESCRFRAGRILGKEDFEAMPGGEIVAATLPAWMRAVANSRIIISSTGAALLIDCGARQAFDELRQLVAKGALTRLEGIHITHYHDDHTDLVDFASTEFDCPVYTGREMREILAAPSRYKMPCLTDTAIRRLEIWPGGEARRWHEFRLTRYYFPGQTLYHDAILVEKDGAERVLLVGDSFTPTGMDDYCLLNRNLLGPGLGYFRCLDLVEKLQPDMLVNQHVGPAFRFTGAQIAEMRRSLERRVAILRKLLPWENPNFGIDEQWARFDPYGLEAAPGATADMAVTIFNHAPAARIFTVTPRFPSAWETAARALQIKAPAGREASASLRVRIPPCARGLQVITADVRFGPWNLGEWIEALIDVRS
jgi:glyoxylase-like metal-dependent hydrolase (beta-lactamase superfamily II)